MSAAYCFWVELIENSEDCAERRWLRFDIDELLVGRRDERPDNPPPRDLTVYELERIIVDKQGMSDGLRGVIHSLMLRSWFAIRFV